MFYYNTMVMMMILLVLLGALLGCRCCADMATMVMVMVMLMIDGTDTDTDTDSAVAAAAAAHNDNGTANNDGEDDDTAGVTGCIVEVERCATDTATGCSARVAGGHRCPFHVTQVSS